MNFIDYLDWRGDLSLEQSPFCEADNLLLACLSYNNLEGILTAPDTVMSIRDLSDAFFRLHSDEELKQDHSFIAKSPNILRALAASKRFQNASVRSYVNLISVEHELQFSAIEILLEDQTSYLSFRGTDDTIVGWKEDFHISLGQIPAEHSALEYTEWVAARTDRPLRLGGHSKGGNLAVYAAACCQENIQERICAVYSNDGPGFTPDFLKSEGLLRIADRIQRFIPEFSVFGTLLEHAVPPVIIKSSGKGVMQHDAFSWEILGPSFVRGEKLHPTARIFDDSLRSWINQIDIPERMAFIEDLFSVLEAPGVANVSDLLDGGFKSAAAMLRQLEKLNPETRAKVDTLLKILLSNWSDYIRQVPMRIASKKPPLLKNPIKSS